MRLVPPLIITVVVVSVALVSCSSESVEDKFADAVSAKNVDAAAALTSDPGSAKTVLTATFNGMGDSTPTVSAADGNDGHHLNWVWGLPGHRNLSYTTDITASGSTITWNPILIHPDMAAGTHLQYADDKAYQTTVVNRRGFPLMTWQTVTVVNLDPAQPESVQSLAPLLHKVDPTVTVAGLQKTVAGQKSPTAVISLRASDATKVGSLAGIPGVTTREEGRLLTVSPSLRSPVISGVQDKWRKDIDAAAGASVSIVDKGGNAVRPVKQFPGTEVEPIRTTIDADLQRAANAAVAQEKRATMLVAIRPSTGGILAVAQNTAADRSGTPALTGLYAPGSTFKTITTAAALADGAVGSFDDNLNCPGRARFGDRSIPNENEFDLGVVPLHTAFAQSCNTTMAGLGTKLKDSSLADTAKKFGLGVDYTVPGITTVTGSVPPAHTDAQRVEESIGQGRVTASPFGMALVEASLATRKTVLPKLFDADATKSDTTPESIDPAIADQLRSAMRETASSGTARSLRDIPGLGGKTGTAEFGDNTHAHGWFAGITGDVAFATLVVSGESSNPAVAVSGAFLRGSGSNLP